VTQLDLDFDPEKARRVRVWLWLTHFASVEAENAAGQYAWPPREPDDERTAMCDAARERFYAKAAEVNGAPITDSQWQLAMAAWERPDP
jgi:hypothetical protein